MMEEVYKAFKEEAARQKEDGSCNTMEVDGMSGFIFANRFGGLHNPQAVNRTIRRILENYNAEEVVNAKKEKRPPVIIPHFSCHHLRHPYVKPKTKIIKNSNCKYTSLCLQVLYLL